MVAAAHHVTQRGNPQQPVFDSDRDREVYLDLLANTAAKARLRVLGYCLMNNHVHLVLLPERESAMAQALGRAHCQYANYFQSKQCTTGHLWQNRYSSCPLSETHLVRAMLYVEHNPVRAGMVEKAMDWPWSTARAHAETGCEGGDRVSDLNGIVLTVPV